MVAAEHLAAGGAALPEGGSPELAAEHHQGRFEQPAALQIVQQGRDRLVGTAAFPGQAAANVLARVRSVKIPAPVKELDETHAALDQATGQQAVVGEAGGSWLGAVFFDNLLGLPGNIHSLGSRHLHLEGELKLGDPGARLRVSQGSELDLVQPTDRIQARTPQLPAHAGRV